MRLFIAPAAVIGLLVIGVAGVAVSYAILELYEKWRRGTPTVYLKTNKPVDPKYSLTEKMKDRLAISGGCITVLVLVIVMVSVSGEWTEKIWMGLKIIGYLACILSFIIYFLKSIPQPGRNRRPPGFWSRRDSRRARKRNRATPKSKIYEAQVNGQASPKVRQTHQAESQAGIYSIQRKRENIIAIRKDFYSVFRISDEQSRKRNHMLADFFNRYFKASNIHIQNPFEIVEQDDQGLEDLIIGVIEIDGCSYLGIHEWCKKTLGTLEVSRHLVQIFNCGYPGGIIITNSGFSQSAINTCKEALTHKVVILCELEEIVALLERNESLKDFLAAKIINAVENKNPLFKLIGQNPKI